MSRVQIHKHPNMVISRPSPVNWTKEYFSKWAWHMKPGMERPELCAEFTTDPKRLYGFCYKEHAQATMGMLLVQLGITTKMSCCPPSRMSPSARSWTASSAWPASKP
jgi:hypothetical protein